MRQPGNDYRMNPHDVIRMTPIENNSKDYLDSVNFGVWMQNTKFRNAMTFCSGKFPNATEADSEMIDTCVNKFNKANHLFYDE
tara:strand:+ start:80 stop:328 length:249 start_codon:yes stop_codon:yes gene_type:complete